LERKSQEEGEKMTEFERKVSNTLWWIALWLFIIAANTCAIPSLHKDYHKASESNINHAVFTSKE
jgi:hypothetical protein